MSTCQSLRQLAPQRVVHDYGDICQTVLEIAVEHAPISVEEFQIAVVDADPHLLTSTVMNLLLNAFENTSPTGR